MHAYCCLWEYRVAPAQRAAFEQAYGDDGAWVRLFRRAPGYLGTELLHDRDDAARYVSVDHWQSRQHYQDFRERFHGEYAALDRACDALTEDERALGEFATLTTAMHHGNTP